MDSISGVRYPPPPGEQFHRPYLLSLPRVQHHHNVSGVFRIGGLIISPANSIISILTWSFGILLVINIALDKVYLVGELPLLCLATTASTKITVS